MSKYSTPYFNQFSDYTANYVEIRIEHNMHSYKDKVFPI
jgi:hypothetical protein